MGTKKKKTKSSTPRHKRLNRVDRLRAARHWIPNFKGENILQGYKKQKETRRGAKSASDI
jgi:hypothetical protein